MGTLRQYLSDHRALAGLLIALALALKALVPAGYMLGADTRVLTIQICADASGAKMTHEIVIPQKSAPAGSQGETGKSSLTCPYAGLGLGLLPGVDAMLLALAIAFILALGFAPQRAAPARHVFQLRPPLRGPPAPGLTTRTPFLSDRPVAHA